VLREEYLFAVTTSILRELDKLKRKNQFARVAAKNILKAQQDNRVNIHAISDNEYADPDIVELARKTGFPVITGDVILSNMLEKCVDIFHIDDFIDFKSFSYCDETSLKREYNGFAYIEGRPGFHSFGEFTAYPDKDVRLFKQKITYKNLEQAMLMGGIRDPQLEMVIGTGFAGTGKTFVALATALELVKNGEYDRIYWSVPPVPVGGIDKYGFVPGDMNEKNKIYCGGLLGGLESFHMNYEELIERETIKILPFNNIRGMSIKNSIIIIDEAQNASLKELKTLGTRTDEGSKVVLLGDLSQSDKYVPTSSGLYTVMSATFGRYPYIGCINLVKNRRGRLSNLFNELF
jgi:predicted ribonuclease YlaK